MNFKLVLRITGTTLLLEAGLLALPLAVTLGYGEDPLPFVWTMALLLVAGFGLRRFKFSTDFFAREGFFTVALIWGLMSAFGALPFWFSGLFGSYVDCLFETASGFTTTGATILTAIEGLPCDLLFWRSFTHWLGGMGVLILTTALFPRLGINSAYLIQAESPGPVPSKLVPKSSQSSKILYSIYLALTLMEMLCLRAAGMGWFDAVNHAFATAGTGGFSTRNLSVGAFQSPVIDVIITVFMLLFSVNFTCYFLVLVGKWKQALGSNELRFFCVLVAASILVISVNILPMYDGFLTSLRHTAFQVASIVSTTGFSTVDFNLWPEFSRMLLVVLMFIGACAGSTGGGIKCARILVLAKSLNREIKKIVHPRSVNVVKLDGEVVSEDTQRSIQVFLVAYMFILFGGALVVGLDNYSFGTNLTAVLACLSNVGPGLELVGPMGNFSVFSDLSKLVLTLCMIVGRLEIFPVLVLTSPMAWKRN